MFYKDREAFFFPQFAGDCAWVARLKQSNRVLKTTGFSFVEEIR